MISWTRLLSNKESWADSIRYSNLARRPVVVWNLTNSCNLQCPHCYLDAHEGAGSSIDIEKAKDVILDMSSFGVPVILFSGGEPLLRKDIFELADLASISGIRPVLSTNGTLITQAMAKKIKKAGFRYVGISIDGSSKTHDRLRSKRGSFEKAVSGIKNCQREGIKTGLRFTLMKENSKDLEFILDLVEKEGIDRLCIYHLVYSGRAKVQDDISPQQKRTAVELIYRYVGEFDKKGLAVEILSVDNHCDGIWIYRRLRDIDPVKAKGVSKLLGLNGGNQAGISIGCVDNLGQVFPDQFSRMHPIGNLFERRFSEIWQDEENLLLHRLRNRKEFIKGRCARCRYFSFCNGNMRSRAFSFYGDFWQEDPACYLTDEEIEDATTTDIL